MTVFRTRRRCPNCQLVNSDNAARCRRCGHSFGKIDRASESERAHSAARTRRIAVAIVAVLLVAGLCVVGYMVKNRSERLSAYTERSSAVESDIVTLKRGAQGDAALIVRAFDDAEVKRLLGDQAAAWDDRVTQCETLGAQVDELVPQNPQQTEHEVGLERDLGALANASRGLAEAAKRKDPFAARIEAAKLTAPDGGADGR